MGAKFGALAEGFGNLLWAQFGSKIARLYFEDLHFSLANQITSVNKRSFSLSSSISLSEYFGVKFGPNLGQKITKMVILKVSENLLELTFQYTKFEKMGAANIEESSKGG